MILKIRAKASSTNGVSLFLKILYNVYSDFIWVLIHYKCEYVDTKNTPYNIYKGYF